MLLLQQIPPPSYDNPISSYDAPIYHDGSYTAAVGVGSSGTPVNAGKVEDDQLNQASSVRVYGSVAQAIPETAAKDTKEKTVEKKPANAPEKKKRRLRTRVRKVCCHMLFKIDFCLRGHDGQDLRAGNIGLGGITAEYIISGDVRIENRVAVDVARYQRWKA